MASMWEELQKLRLNEPTAEGEMAPRGEEDELATVGVPPKTSWVTVLAVIAVLISFVADSISGGSPSLLSIIIAFLAGVFVTTAVVLLFRGYQASKVTEPQAPS
jgi:hypothetical protein